MTDMALGVPAYVVLGMIRLGRRSGYEIKRAVDISIRFFWTISQAQIYPSLERLEREGLVRGRDEPRGNRPRRVYEITAAGEDALEEWLRRREPMPLELRDVGLLKLFFADALGPEEARDLLRAVRRRSQEYVDTLGAFDPEAREVEDQGDAHPRLTLRMGIAFHQALLEVCDRFEREVEETARG